MEQSAHDKEAYKSLRRQGESLDETIKLDMVDITDDRQCPAELLIGLARDTQYARC